MKIDELIAYLAGELGSDEADLERRLFSGELDGPELTELAELTVGLREAAFLGILSILVSRSEMQHLRSLGYRILDCPMRPGEVVTLDLRGDFDLVFVEYHVALGGVTRLDIEVCDASGVPFKRYEDTVLPAPGTLLSGFCARELALAGILNNPGGMVTRFVSVEPGGDRVVAEFVGKALLPDA
jgi:hypothetical protein